MSRIYEMKAEEGTLAGECYQISDDDIDENDGVGDDSAMDGGEASQISRGPYERAWTTDATRALIHIRGPLEDKFSEGRQKRTTLWLYVTRQLHKLGYRYNAAKVQKKWHNILITYNKNLNKKYLSGNVHWEFFEEMFKYLQGKKADCDQSTGPQFQDDDGSCSQFNTTEPLAPHVQIEGKSTDEYEDSSCSPEAKKTKFDYSDNPIEMPLEITHENGDGDAEGEGTTDFMDGPSSNWWKDYFERKLQVEKDKIDLQKDMHRDLMHFNKMSLIQQEKIERIKIDAINSLTATLQKLVEVKNKKG